MHKNNILWGQCIKNSEEDDNDENTEKKTSSFIETVGNRIFFYANIESDKILQLNKQIRETDNEHIVSNQNIVDLPPIFLHIHSIGGDIFGGFSALDNILQCKSKVISIVDGVCASSATFLSVGAKERYIMNHSFMLIHQLSSGFWGKYSEFSDEMKNLNMFMKHIQSIYQKYTKLPSNKLSEILKRDLFFDAKTCLKYGMVDKII